MVSVQVKNLSKSFGKKQVLENISFNVQNGESFVIMGGSGCGKSVTIKCIIGLLEADAGSEIYIDNKNVVNLTKAERMEFLRGCGVLFQGGALFDSLTVWQNIAFAKLNTNEISKAKAQKLAVEKLHVVGLGADVAHLFPSELSGGMQKRVALARAIAFNPKMIFFDEPTAGLDPIMSGVISELIKRCSQDLGATTITITHDMNCAKMIADKAALLHNGNFIWHGKGLEIMHTQNEYMKQFVNGLANGPITVSD